MSGVAVAASGTVAAVVAVVSALAPAAAPAGVAAMATAGSAGGGLAEALPWVTVAALGALHGVNPGMGWLFAVSLGLQERRAGAVWRSLGPLAVGHLVAIGVVVAVAAAVGLVVPTTVLKWAVAGLLLGLGVYRLVRNRHPRYGGMRVGPRELATWSFLMASAHGAGLMVLPFLVGPVASAGAAAGAHGHHEAHVAMGGVGAVGDGMATAAVAGAGEVGLLLTLAHTLGYLLVCGTVALAVYHWVGLRLLRTAWVNMDLIWAGALILTALVTPWL